MRLRIAAVFLELLMSISGSSRNSSNWYSTVLTVEQKHLGICFIFVSAYQILTQFSQINNLQKVLLLRYNPIHDIRRYTLPVQENSY